MTTETKILDNLSSMSLFKEAIEETLYAKVGDSLDEAVEEQADTIFEPTAEGDE